MKQYLDLMKEIKTNGRYKGNRTGTGTKSVFGYQMRFNLMKNFPLLTTKKLHLRSIIHELIWFLNGETNIKYLKDNGVNIWNEWANEKGELGPVYGKMWREWPKSDGSSIDQITELMDNLKNKPFSRRHVISAYNPDLLPVEGQSHKENVENGKQALPPCHTLFQFNVIDATLDERLEYIKNNPETIHHLEQTFTQSAFEEMDIFQSLSLISLSNNDSQLFIFKEYLYEIIKKIQKTKKKQTFTNFELLEHLSFKTFCDTIINRDHTGMYQWFNNNVDLTDLEKSADNYYYNFAIYINELLNKFDMPSQLLDCQLYQRSADVFLGVPFNIASYSLLVYMIAQQTNMIPHDFIWTGGDCHIYNNHSKQTDLQLTREPLAPPRLVINRKPDSIFDYTFDDFSIENYQFHSHIAGPISV